MDKPYTARDVVLATILGARWYYAPITGPAHSSIGKGILVKPEGVQVYIHRGKSGGYPPVRFEEDFVINFCVNFCEGCPEGWVIAPSAPYAMAPISGIRRPGKCVW